MATYIEMPKLSDTMTEGTVVRWLKNLGDEVEIGDEIAEIETDKATMAMEAFDEGILSEILIEEGGKAAVGATLAILRDEGEAAPAPVSAPEEETPAEAPASTPQIATDANLEPVAIEVQVPEPTPEPASSPVTRPATFGRIKASPLARKMAETNGVDLAGLRGSGPGGRIVRKDVVGAMGKADSAGSTAKSAGAAPPVPAPTPEPAHSLGAGDQRIELSSLRRITAERLLASKTTIPHFYLHTEADAAPLMEIRRQVNLQAEATHGNKYTVNDLILKAVIGALQAVPSVNATFQRRPHFAVRRDRGRRGGGSGGWPGYSRGKECCSQVPSADFARSEGSGGPGPGGEASAQRIRWRDNHRFQSGALWDRGI